MKPLGWFLSVSWCCPNCMAPGTATTIFSPKPVSSQSPIIGTSISCYQVLMPFWLLTLNLRMTIHSDLPGITMWFYSCSPRVINTAPFHFQSIQHWKRTDYMVTYLFSIKSCSLCLQKVPLKQGWANYGPWAVFVPPENKLFLHVKSLKKIERIFWYLKLY